MRVPPSHVSFSRSGQNLGIHRSEKSVASTFLTKSSPNEKGVSQKNSLITRAELSQMASDLKCGIISKDQLNHRFVDTIVNNSVAHKLSEDDRKKMVQDISQFFSDDPEFVKDLEKNLLNLG